MEKYQVMTIRELAKHLKIGEKTIYTLAQNGELPAFKVGGQWRFRSHDVEHWIDSQTASNSRMRSGYEALTSKKTSRPKKRGFETNV